MNRYFADKIKQFEDLSLVANLSKEPDTVKKIRCIQGSKFVLRLTKENNYRVFSRALKRNRTKQENSRIPESDFYPLRSKNELFNTITRKRKRNIEQKNSVESLSTQSSKPQTIFRTAEAFEVTKTNHSRQQKLSRTETRSIITHQQAF